MAHMSNNFGKLSNFFSCIRATSTVSEHCALEYNFQGLERDKWSGLLECILFHGLAGTTTITSEYGKSWLTLIAKNTEMVDKSEKARFGVAKSHSPVLYDYNWTLTF